MQKHPKLSLIEHFKKLPDPRINRTKDHDLIDVLIIALCSLLCAAESFYDMEEFGRAKGRIGSKLFWVCATAFPRMTRSTGFLPPWTRRSFWSVFWPGRRACAMLWTRRLSLWMARRCDGPLMAIFVINISSAPGAERNGLVLGQQSGRQEQRNHRRAPVAARAGVAWSGCIVTIDAMGCQKKIAREIIESEADYLLELNGNHDTVHQEDKTVLDETLAERQRPRLPGSKHSKAADALAWLETVEKDHTGWKRGVTF